MQISVSTRHGNLSQESRDKITEKAEKLPRFFERLTAIDVIVDVEHPENPSVEIRVSAEHHEDFVATDNSSSLMAAADGAVAKLEQQLRRHKEKVKSRRTPGHRHQDVANESPAGEIDDAGESDEGESV